jgi:hypothetical protein
MPGGRCKKAWEPRIAIGDAVKDRGFGHVEEPKMDLCVLGFSA